MKLYSRNDTEDFFHDIIAKILPKLNKSDIRPAFQKTKQPNMAGRNFISNGDESNNGLVGFTNTDDFCYFNIEFERNNDNESEVLADGKVFICRRINLIVYLYGNNSPNNALLVKALMRSLHIQNELNRNGYYQISEGVITPLNEEINGEWWERHDVAIEFECLIELEPEKENISQSAIGYNTGEADPVIVVDNKRRV